MTVPLTTMSVTLFLPVAKLKLKTSTQTKVWKWR